MNHESDAIHGGGHRPEEEHGDPSTTTQTTTQAERDASLALMRARLTEVGVWELSLLWSCV